MSYPVGDTKLRTVVSLYSKETFDGKPQREGYSYRDIEKLTCSKSPTVPSDRVKPTPYAITINEIVSNTPWSVSSKAGYFEWVDSGSFAGNFLPSLDFSAHSNPEDPAAEANVQALNGLRGQQLQLSVSAIESKKTLDQIANTCSTALKALGAARRGRWGDVPGLLGMNVNDVLKGKYPANRWLEYQYGWKPLYQDIHDTTEVFKHGVKKTNEKSPFRSQGSNHISSNWTDRGSVGFKGAKGDTTYEEVKSAKVVYTYAIKRDLLVQLDSLGFLNPATIAWELVPFSFAIDWFVPIGSMLSAISASAGLDIRTAYTSKKTVRAMTKTFETCDSSYDQSSILNPGDYVQREMSFVRTVATSPFPVEMFTNPNPFSTAHVRNALALLTQLL